VKQNEVQSAGGAARRGQGQTQPGGMIPAQFNASDFVSGFGFWTSDF
jgi:hypothetical protein